MDEKGDGTAARRIERAQGWQTEANTWSEVNERGEIVRKPYSSEQTKNPIPQKVQDMENLTGEQSAIRKAQNALKDKEKLRGLSTWADFYNLLSLNGMKYQKKGSGAVITIDGVTVKASDVSRNLALGKLEKQLGLYREIYHLAQVVCDGKSISPNPQPLDDANRDNKNWSAYIRARTEQARENKERRERLYMTQQEERKEQRKRQKLERQAFSESFGKGIRTTRRDINRQRSILATKHAYERAVLKEKQKEQRESLKNQSAALMSYEQWLRNRNMPEEAEKWRHRKNKRILLLESPYNTTGNEPREYAGLSGFSMTVTRQGVKFASQDKPDAAAFVDMGRVIKVYDQGDKSTLAALRLAQSKWGGVQVSGTEVYKRKCAELAARYGIRLFNPELWDRVKELKRKNEEAEEERKRRMAELDRSFEKGIYPPGTMGFRLQVDHALEVLKLERERGALRFHPVAAAVLEKAEEYRRRERGLGR
jgi:hypothetical protein